MLQLINFRYFLYLLSLSTLSVNNFPTTAAKALTNNALKLILRSFFTEITPFLKKVYQEKVKNCFIQRGQ